MKKLSLLFLISVFAVSCGDSSLTRTLPNVTGTTGEVLVVMDKNLWDGGPGDAIRNNVAAYLVGMPQPERAFSLLQVPPAAFRDLFLAYRNVLMAEIDPDVKTPTLIKDKDKWAETQVVMDIVAPDSASLRLAIIDKAEEIRKTINDAERSRLTAWLTEAAGKERCSFSDGDASYEILLPAGYKPDFVRDGIMMISAETPSTTQSVIVSVADRTEEAIDCISLANLTEMVTSAEVKGAEGSFMVIYKDAPVSCRSFRRNNTDYIEMRGLWTLEGGFMGGPFISYAYIDPHTLKAVVVTGFVYAPQEDKRELLRQVEALMYTVKSVS